MKLWTALTLLTLVFAFAMTTYAASDNTVDPSSASGLAAAGKAKAATLTDGEQHTLTITADKDGTKHYKTAGKVMPSSDYGKAFHNAITKYLGEINAKRANLIRSKLIVLKEIFLVSEKRVHLPATFQPFFSEKMLDEERARATNYLNDEIINVVAELEALEQIAAHTKK